MCGFHLLFCSFGNWYIYIYIYADKYDVYINNIGENVTEQQFGSYFVLISNTDESGRINVEHVLVETKSNTQGK